MSGLANRTFTGMNITTPIPTVLPEIPSGGGPLPPNGVFTNPAISVDNQGRIRTIEDAGGGGGGLSNITIGPGLEPTGLLVDGSTLQVNYNAGPQPNIITAAAPQPATTTTGAILIQENPGDDVRNIALSNIGLSSFAELTSDLNMNNANKVTNLPNPNVGSDAANKNYVDGAVITGGTLRFQGGYAVPANTPNITNPSPPGLPPGSNGITAGATYVVTIAGTITWPDATTIVAEVGEVLIAGVDNPTTAADWVDVQRNTGLATELSTGICRFPTAGDPAFPPGATIPLSVSNGAVGLDSINLASQVTGNLPVTNLNNGPPPGQPAANYFWCGNGTWSIPTPPVPVQPKASYKIDTAAATSAGASNRDVFAEGFPQVIVTNDTEVSVGPSIDPVNNQMPFINITVAGEYFVQFSGSLLIQIGGVSDTITMRFAKDSGAGTPQSVLNEMLGEYYDNDIGFPFSMNGIYNLAVGTRFFIQYTNNDPTSDTAWRPGTAVSLFKLT